MQDKKINGILKKHMNNNGFNSYPNEVIKVFGENFITKMSKLYEYKEDLFYRLTEALKTFENLKDITDDKELKKLILFSFQMQPEISLSERQSYIIALLYTKDLYEDIQNSEKRIGLKIISWYENINDRDNLEIATTAVNDYELSRIQKSQKERQKKIWRSFYTTDFTFSMVSLSSLWQKSK